MPSDKITPWLRASTFLAKGPRYIGSYAAWRVRRLLRSCFAGAPRWPAVEELRAAVPAPGSAGESFPGDAGRFEASLRAHYASRAAPRPLCDWSRRGRVAALVPEAARSRTIAKADAIVKRRFQYRGVEARFTGAVDWAHRAAGNLDWTWDLNRHHFFVVLGRAYGYTADERYARAFVDLLTEWMAANPPGVNQPAWRSVFEAGVRVANWCWAHALFLRSPSLDDRSHLEILRGILGIARFLHAQLERHAWNNHLLLEAKALAMVGALYPELPGAADWKREGIRHLETELERQVLLDGVHSERSSLYLAIISSEILEHLVVLQLEGRGERDPHYCRALVKLAGMALFQAAITRADGTMPLLGDSSRTDEHMRFDAPLGARVLLGAQGIPSPPRADEGLIWLLAALGLEDTLERNDGAAPARGRSSRAFRDGGYFVLESDSGAEPLHLVFDCGPFGDPIVPGHGHADALSIDLAAGKSHLIVDPGMYSAHLGERWRNGFRGTAAHNTVVVDGKDQSLLSGLRRVYRPARARLIEWASCGAFDVVAGMHLGYTRLDRPVTHRREIFFRKPHYWLVVDRLDGRGHHGYELLFHLCPGAAPVVVVGSACVTARGTNGAGLAILPVGVQGLSVDVIEGLEGIEDSRGGAGEAPQGWVAFESGVKAAAPVVRHRREGSPPVRFATVLFPLLPGGAVCPEIEALAAQVEPQDHGASQLVAGRLLFPGGAVETFLAGPVMPHRPDTAPVVRRAGELETDAHTACVFVGAEGNIESGVVFRGNELRWRGDVVAQLESMGLPGHFAFEAKGRRLDVHTTGPVLEGSAMRLHGLPARAGQVFLNGAETDFRKEGGALVLCLGNRA